MTDQRLYPAGLADKLKARAGEKYRPSNGSEGEMFMDRFCDRCAKDQSCRDGAGDSCPIVAASFAYDVDDEKYPAEWQYGPDGQPTCTAFEKVDPP